MESTPFDDRFARLSRSERAAFVGALLAARGWAVTVDSAVIRATTDDDRLVVAVAREGLLPGHGLPREPVDVVVGVDSERTERLATARDARAWDAHALYEVARHGLDEAATDWLFSTHLGASGDAIRPPGHPGDRVDTVAAETGRAPSLFGLGRWRPLGPDDAETAAAERGATGHTRRVVVLLLAIALLVGPPLTVLSLAELPRADTGDRASDEGVGANGTRAAPATPTLSPTPEPTQVAPGVSASEITDTPALARAHASLLRNQSFTMRITYAERVGRGSVGTAQETVSVENGTVYRSRGTRSGNLTSVLMPVIVRDIYADGETRYLAEADGAVRIGGADDAGAGRFVERSRALVVWYLSGLDSSVLGQDRQGDEVYYWIEVSGDSDPRIENYQAIALVTARGLVVRIDARYRLPESDRVVTVSLRHVSVGNTTVERPAWMPPRNESTNRTVDVDR